MDRAVPLEVGESLLLTLLHQQNLRGTKGTSEGAWMALGAKQTVKARCPLKPTVKHAALWRGLRQDDRPRVIFPSSVSVELVRGHQLYVIGR